MALRSLNVSTTFRGAWFGNMIPPAPSRMRSVWLATWAIMISGEPLERLAALWCSANQTRSYPSDSATFAIRTETAIESDDDCPSMTYGISRTERERDMNPPVSMLNAMRATPLAVRGDGILPECIGTNNSKVSWRAVHGTKKAHPGFRDAPSLKL